ncbi:hypothetical protein Y032_0003g1622 [Ancylostoma ceylanicum]|uniref:Uncharacterized protein n=1 Tax=Ancylostoma ceylanicum TaxID=53326 RepID=A0A016VYP4_9BILA|nr:hypothetical protein Y032_0003g1622 [Ancylostoma ceylanicum]
MDAFEWRRKQNDSSAKPGAFFQPSLLLITPTALQNGFISHLILFSSAILLKLSAQKARISGEISTKHDVYVLIIDSVSSFMAKRSLSKTITYLKKQMSAVQMEFLNKVGYNSRPNGFALAFGKSIEGGSRNLVGLPPLLPDWNITEICNNYLDSYSYYLFDYEEEGYKKIGGCLPAGPCQPQLHRCKNSVPKLRDNQLCSNLLWLYAVLTRNLLLGATAKITIVRQSSTRYTELNVWFVVNGVLRFLSLSHPR